MISLGQFTRTGVQQALNAFWNAIKSLYPARQVAGASAGMNGGVNASFGLRAVAPVQRIGQGQYRVFMDESISLSRAIILVCPITEEEQLRSAIWSLNGDPSERIDVQIFGMEDPGDPIIPLDTDFHIMVWEVR
jgi:hypothetical protein